MPITLPIIDQFVHPALGLLATAPVDGSPWDVGQHFSVIPPQSALALTYGLVFSVNSTGPGHGKTMGSIFPKYTPPLALVSCQYQMIDSLSVWTQYAMIDREWQTYFWDEPLPAMVWIEQAPDVSLSLYWLQT